MQDLFCQVAYFKWFYSYIHFFKKWLFPIKGPQYHFTAIQYLELFGKNEINSTLKYSKLLILPLLYNVNFLTMLKRDAESVFHVVFALYICFTKSDFCITHWEAELLPLTTLRSSSEFSHFSENVEKKSKFLSPYHAHLQ